MRKLLFVILIPFLGIAQDFTANGIKYTVTSSRTPFTVKVARNAGFTGVAEIPETVAYNSKNYAVTAIGGFAFEYCDTLTSVTIPNSVTTIEEYAFTSCTGLTAITIPDSVTSIEEGGFILCSALTSIILPKALTTIGKHAFQECTNLRSVTIPNSVTSIGFSAFKSCTSLTSVTIPNSVTSIGLSAFKSCTSLTSVTIPNSVTAIGEFAFGECTNLNLVNCYITTPLIIDGSVFLDVRISKARLNVPVGAEIAYEAARVWNRFKTISGSLLSNHSFAIESALKIYPNPVSEILNIALQEDIQLEKVNFYNTLGQLIKTTNHSEINVSSFAKGNYFVEIMTNQGKVTKTIIIQ
ncbi:leucine-rich repeat domain-containing protein [Flavobacterium psychrophilum]|uniref:leucine-rich repeat domain-containing protein n=2 Tax=Flavobacterium psychrophilum TaxID=96345 RepID=UPI000B7C2A61|nr:leucine-rich repeat domain-containing protein [Flavobacterium psychrophilum]EKT3964331.1 leucine-rich repeat domain-containing protein [Flavobacterium psychrophilum]EKT4517792.1 leucine-rich repeat domain-containing protein [Flavobacterium psychrophilum]MCB6004206.1 leucine-rich repeat protein [Flavobacterium psychrophilum]MCB6091596.1 leucine-rich repeat protein [Flavobacterium psychrophilum]MCB6120484.1 leucine-rich repeat protein [Flavobacterium psychrophilum]